MKPQLRTLALGLVLLIAQAALAAAQVGSEPPPFTPKRSGDLTGGQAGVETPPPAPPG